MRKSTTGWSRKWGFDPAPMRAKRLALGLTVTAFGKRILGGVRRGESGHEPEPMSGNQIEGIEEQSRGLTVETLLRICNAYGMSPVEFFRRER